MTDVVVDTHALLWYFDADGSLSSAARRALDDARTVDVAAISFWEIEMLRRKRRVTIDRSTSRWRHDLMQLDRFNEIPLDGRLGITAAALEGFHGDPADRLIVATALEHGSSLVSKDRQIQRWAADHDLDVVW